MSNCLRLQMESVSLNPVVESFRIYFCHTYMNLTIAMLFPTDVTIIP